MAKKSLIAKAKRSPRHPVQAYHRCTVCGRPRAFMRRFAPGSPGWRLPLMVAARRRPWSVSCYQLDLVTPGSWPSRARSRKQIRHRANRRM